MCALIKLIAHAHISHIDHIQKTEDTQTHKFSICVATGGVGDSFVLLPRILGCWGSFARAFLPGRSTREASQIFYLGSWVFR